MIRLLTFLSTGALLVTVGTVAATQTSAASAPTVEFTGGLVSVTVSEAPLNAVLAAIAAAARVPIVVSPSRTEPVTANLVGVPVDEAIRRLVQGRDTIFVYEAATGSREHRLKAVRVFAKGQGPGSASRPRMEQAVRPGEGLPEERRLALERQLSAGDDLARVDAVAALRASGDARVLPLLAPALKDPEEGVRMAAVDAFDHFGGETSADVLAGALPGERLPALRVEMVRVLARLGGARATESVSRAFAAEQDGLLRATLLSVAAMGEPAVRAALLAQALGDPDPTVRRVAQELSRDFALRR